MTLALALFVSTAHAQISVGPSGSITYTFDSTPPSSEWSTVASDTIGGNAGAIQNAGALEADVQTRAASLFSVTVGTSSTVPPSAHQMARRNTTLNALQTVATGSSYTPLMATLRNDSGVERSFVVIDYDLSINNAEGTIVVEQVYGHLVFWSLTGEPGSWQLIPSISDIGDPGPMSAVLNLGSWAPGSLLYILWIDDNGSVGRNSTGDTEGAYLIDNFMAFFEVTPVEIVTQPASQTVLQGTAASLSVTVSGMSPTFQWYKNNVAVPGATSATLSFSAVTLADAGDYHVVVSNPFPSTDTSEVATLTVTPNPPVITTHPEDQTVLQGRPFSLAVAATGAFLQYQWYKDGLPIEGATSATFAISSAELSDAGSYHVVVRNLETEQTSNSAVVTVIQDTFPPVLLSALAINNTNIILTFDEPIDPFSVDPHSVFVVQDDVAFGLGDDAESIPPGQLFSTRVLVTTFEEMIFGVNYDLQVFGGITDAYGNEMMDFVEIPIARQIRVFSVDADTTWKYFDLAMDPPGDWRTAEFNDSDWQSGAPVLLAYNAEPPTEVDGAPVRTDMNWASKVIFFRQSFQLPGPVEGASLQLRTLIDDGAIFFLNGVEIFRIGMPAAATGAYANRANRTADGRGSFEGPFTIPEDILASALREGENVLAVSVHQVNETSSDLTFALEMDVVVQRISQGPVEITCQPVGGTFVEGQNVMLSVCAQGGIPISYEWFHDGAPVEGATSSTLILANAKPGQSGSYTVRVSNLENFEISDPAMITITPDTEPPTMVSGSLGVDTFTVTFSEEIDLMSINNDNIEIAPADGGPALTLLLVQVDFGTNLVLTTGPVAPNTTYLLTVSGIKDLAENQNEIAPGSQMAFIPVFGMEQVWSFYPILPKAVDPFGGTAWTAPEFDDSAWESGVGLFGQETTPYPYPMVTFIAAPASGGADTVYFRTEFDWNAGTEGVVLSSINYVDDGLVVYLNGVEVSRTNVPTGTITHLTKAPTANPGGEPVTMPLAFSAENLVQGRNVLAVSLHQAGDNSSDAVFGMTLSAATTQLATGPATITAQPVGGVWDEGETVTLRVTAEGSFPINYEWRRNGTPVPGGTMAALTLENAKPSQSGAYTVHVSNTEGNETSTPVTVTINPDTVPPSILSVIASSDLVTFRILFSEPIDPASVNPANIQITPVGGGAALTVLNTSVSGNELTVTTSARTPGVDYALSISGITDLAETPIPMQAVAGASILLPVIDMDTVWKFWGLPRGPGTGGEEPDPFGPGWVGLEFNDDGWFAGTALFGFETTPLIYPYPFNTEIAAPNNDGPVNIYFRTEFQWHGSTDGLVLISTNWIDDGMAVYLNGVEVMRYNMPEGPIAYDSLAISANPAGEAVPIVRELSLASAVEGRNVLAVSVHNNSITSSDTVFGMEVFVGMAEVDSPVLTIQRSDNNIVITWAGAGFRLQQRSSLTTGSWADVPGGDSSPVTLPIGAGTMFFRLTNE